MRLSLRSAATTLAASALLAGCMTGRTTPPAPGGSTASAAQPAADVQLRGSFAGPLGLQLYSVRDAIRADVPGTLARVRALGVRDVELAGTAGMSAAGFRAALDAAGLRAVSMHVGYERLRDSLPAVLAEAGTLGVRYVGVAWIPHPGGQPFTPDMARAAAADFGRWGAAARAQGLRFFYHIHGYEFQPAPDGVRPLDVLIQGTDAADVSYELDVFWASRPGANPAELIRQYPGRWALLHLKDMRRGTPTNDYSGGADPNATEVPVGSGQIDYRAVLQAARTAGAAYYFIEDETAAPFATIPQSVAWLSTVRW